MSFNDDVYNALEKVSEGFDYSGKAATITGNKDVAEKIEKITQPLEVALAAKRAADIAENNFTA